jgi:hypothetical protein
MTSSILPPGEMLRRAVKWISDQRLDHPQESIQQLVEQASFRYDLSPGETDWLLRSITETPRSPEP